MTTLNCDLCDHTAQGATFEEWMEAMKPHYKEAHADFMQAQMKKAPEEQQKEMGKWMEENKARFETVQ